MKCAKGVLPAVAVLFFITVLTHFPVSAETYFASDDYKYTYRFDGTIAVAGYMGTSSVLDIPSQISDRDVTEISWSAFYGNKNITEVNFPETIKTISDSAFSGCINLKKIIIPASVTKIGANAFYSCSSAETIEIKGQPESIEKYSFNRCSSVKEITLPETVKSIGEYAFYGCKSLEYVYIPPATTYIEEHAFDGCDKLVIYGYSGSYAETFANEKGIEFSSVGEVQEANEAGGNSFATGGNYNKFENNNAGDLNADGVVNNLDCELLQKFLTKKKECFFGKSTYDFNGDGRFNVIDVTCLQLIIVGYIV